VGCWIVNSSVSVQDLQNAYGYGTDEALFPDGDFFNLLNQALEEITYSGKWKGALVKTTFPASDGKITLPFDMFAVIGSNWGNNFGSNFAWGCWGGVTPVFPESHEFIESGPGHLDETKCFIGILVDDQDGHATIIDIPPGLSGTLRLKLQVSGDQGKTIRFNALNQLGEPYYDVEGLGFNITTAYPVTNPTQIVSDVTGLQIPAMIAPWSLYFVDSLGNEIWLATYYPPQRSGVYRRYKTGTTRQPIRVLCQRRFVPVSSPTDWVYPGHIGAMKSAMKAVQKEDSTTEAEGLWQTAYQKLNEQVHSMRGGARLEVPPANFGYHQGFDCLM